MVAVVLALSASVCWGFADFIGGVQSRRRPLATVLWVSQMTALALLLAGLASGMGIEHDAAATLWAAGAGLLGVIGLAAFYRALAIGTMSVVAPLSATGVAIPVLVGLVSGERPSGLQATGMALAVIGVVLAAREAPGEDAQARRASRVSIGLALVAAVGFGGLFAGMDRAEETADVGWVLLAARIPEVIVLSIVFALGRPRVPTAPRELAPLAAIGVGDLLANMLFTLAAGRGLLSVVGVLGALYPAVTVLLARLLLHERPTRVQDLGVAACLAGVLAIAAG